MSTSSDASLGAIRLQAQQRADLENNPAVSIPEWNQYISQSFKELYDLLIGAYGNDYYVATTYPFTLGSSQFVPLPDGTSTYTNSNGGVAQKFYKLLGVDLQYSASPSGYVSLRRFEFLERNKYAYPNVAVNWNGYTNLRYRLEGDNLYFIPVPMSGQSGRAWYIPAPTALQFQLAGNTNLQSGTITGLFSTVGLTAGMSVSGTGVPSGATISSVGLTTVLITASATASANSVILSFWSDATRMDGIAGWEEYIVVDAAMKAQIKQEGPFEPLLLQKNMMRERINSMAEGRDAGQAHHTTDALGANGNFDGFDGGGWGMGGTGFW